MGWICWPRIRVGSRPQDDRRAIPEHLPERVAVVLSSGTDPSIDLVPSGFEDEILINCLHDAQVYIKPLETFFFLINGGKW